MAENRGNSSGSNTNMPTGVRKNTSVSNDSFNYIDPKTMKEIGIVNKGLARFAETLSGNLEKYNKLIIKSSKELVDTRQKLDKDSRELDEQLAEMKKHYFGKNKKVYEDFEKQIEMKKVEMEKEYEDLRISTRKEFLKQQIKFEKEQSDRKFVDSSYVKGHDFDKINNSYASELVKLQESFLEVYGEGYKDRFDYKRALSELNTERYQSLSKESFKRETELNKFNFIDSDFAKGNNLKAVSNKYYKALEELKSKAVDVYGDFENQDEYKKALMNLNNTYAQDMKDAWKKDFKENHKVLGSISDGIKQTFEKNKEVFRGMLGPLNLIIEPIKDFFGGFGLIFKGIKGGIKGIFGKFTKKNPNANDVLKSGAFGVGSLFIGHKLDELFGKNNKSNEDKIEGLKNLFGGKLLGGALTKTISSALPITSIAIGLIWMAVDAIRGVFKAKEWGTSKIAGGLGGLLGGTDSGIKGAFKNMGKWALLGVGKGFLVGGPVGAIAGGLIGGAIGMIFGAIGGERLAKGFDIIGKWFKEVWFTSLIEVFDDMLNISKFKEIFKGKGSIGKKIGKALGLLFVTIIKLPIKLLTSGGSFIKKIMTKTFEGKNIKDALNKFGTSIINGLGDAWSSLKNWGSSIGDKAKQSWETMKNFGGDVWEGIKESELGNFVSSLFTSLKDGINKFFKENPVGVWVKSSIITPIQKALGTIGDFFSYISDNWDWSSPIDSIKKVFGGFTADKKTGLSNFDIWREAKYAEVEDAIIRTDGSIIKTNPKDTLVALKDVPLSMDKVRAETNKSLNGSLTQIERDGTLEKKLTTIIDVLSQILAKDVSVQLPPQTRNDLDMLMSGGMI